MIEDSMNLELRVERSRRNCRATSMAEMAYRTYLALERVSPRGMGLRQMNDAMHRVLVAA